MRISSILLFMLIFTQCSTPDATNNEGSDSSTAASDSTSAATTAAAVSEETNAITGQHWRLIQLLGQEVTPVENQPDPHLMLSADSARVTGHTGCNNFTGGYELDGLNVSFSTMAVTLRACVDMRYEQNMLQVLEQADNYSLNSTEDTLSLNRARMAPLAVFAADHSE